MNENEKSNPNNRNVIRTDKKQSHGINLNADHSLVGSAESNNDAVHSHMIRQSALQEHIFNDVDNEKREVIYDESNNERDSDDTAPHEYTKQFMGSHNTHMIDDVVNDSNGKAEIGIKNKSDKLTRDEVKFGKQTHGNISDSLLRIKSKINERKIKDNAKIKDFTVHIFNQSLDIFDKMKKNTDDAKIKRKLKALRESYIEKFSDFVKETEEHKLKTKLANQNVILHTIDVNNYILKRIVNYLSEDKDASAARISGIVNIFKNELEKEKNIENKHACSKLSICRSDKEYSDFIIKILDIILLTDNRKMKQASDALTEVIKTNDLTNIIQNETQYKLRKLMTNMESWDPFVTRSMFLILRSAIAYKNLPFTVSHISELEAINRTVTLHSIIDFLNKNMGTVENKNEWKDVIKRMEDWRDNKRNDVQKTIELIIRQIIKELEKKDVETRNSVNCSLDELLSRRRRVT
ncbi:uncharacterized protein LOC126779969 isoform X2 [Nymphalis io]|nr:uncharacterized protein LOC126779969 isoform X2 [Nymphalis io]